MRDNVATALTDLEAGETIELKIGERDLIIRLTKPVPFGHKFSLAALKRGAQVMKYGEIIGKAVADIQPGDYVHVHNLVSMRGRGDLS
jgi:altronate dehydratase small subunit